MIYTAIIEDNDLVRNVMYDLISCSNDICCVGTFSVAEDFIRRFSTLILDVVIMDIALPGMSGIECIELLKPKRPKVQYLVCTSHNHQQKTFDSLCAGATGYLLKHSMTEKLHESIRDIHKGGSPMSAEIARYLVNAVPNKKKNAGLLDSFTSREQEILHALAKGYQYGEIARQLFISIETVRTYLRKIYEKLQVHSKVEALNKVFPKEYMGY